MKLDARMIPGTGRVRFLSFEVTSDEDTREVDMLTFIAITHLQGGGTIKITLPDGRSREWSMGQPHEVETHEGA